VTLTDKNIKQFQAIYKEQFGTDISKAEAAEQGLKLVNLLSVVYKPMTQERSDTIDTHRQLTQVDLETLLGGNA
jgi:hypothetical protein